VAGARGLFTELRRRNVLRAGALYVATAWALAQGAAQLLPVYDVSPWVLRWIIAALVVGFPFWIAFAWFYEITPSGLKRESEIAPGDSIAHSTGRKLDFWIIGILAIAVVLLVTNTFVLHRDATSTANAASAQSFAAELAKVPQKSVAVLPLANESGNAKQQYFVDGMSEELISDLTQINGLKVIGKYSSFKFRDSKDSPAQIGATLGVAHLIQGSVFQQGDQIRVTVSMIRAKDGSSVWSHSYDEPLKHVFAIQTKVGQAVAAALKVKLLGQMLGINDKPPSGNVEAYQLLLQGRALARHGTEAGLRQGIALTRQALKLDPHYAYAWGELSNAWVNLGVLFLTGDAQQQAYAQARVAADRQQALTPDAAATHRDRGYLLASIDHDPKGALAEYQRAYALAPNDGTVMGFLALGYENVGQLQPAVDLFRKAIATDPLRPDFYANLAIVLLAQGQLDAAEQAIRKALALQPDYPQIYMNLAQIDILRGNAAAAARDARQETDPQAGPWIRAMAQQIGPDHKQADAALQAYLAKHGKTQPYFVADLYALRKQPAAMFEWLQRALKQHDPNFTSYLLSDPFLTQAYQRDPRFAALCKQAGLPLPGQPLPTASSSSGG
jgi:TolB-like protein/Tfp pilus assembly protein PilF